MNNIYNYTLNELELYFEKIGDKKFKASQVFEWLYKKRVNSFDEMTNVKKDTLSKMKEDFNFNKLTILNKLEGEDVIKYLFNLSDNNKVEAVLMKHDYGNSLCVSTEVGCNMGCSFCESGRLKKVRNLEVYEMVLPILQMKFIDIINSGKGIDIGSRHITVSTCGIVPKIKEFINNGKQVNLAISLHAPNDEIRNKIMPINKAYNITELMEVLKEYISKTNRRKWL